jgi:hypothetical protein
MMKPTTQPELAGGPGSDAEDDTPAGGAPDADASSEGQETPNVTPQEQQLYEKVVTYAYKLIFDPHALPTLLRKLAQGASDMPATIGSTGAMILKSIQAKAMQQDKVDIPGDVLYAAAAEVIGALIDLAVGAGAMKEAQRQDVAKGALFEGLKLWGKTMQASNQITPSVQNQAKQQLASHGIKQTVPQLSAAPPAPAGPPPVGIANQGVAAPQGQ